ncbi:roadblock/LC7 domain-containing protein [Amycolatopsis sp. FBCC-B4732]|uniref:roadblock/LC7 domain-containing protein n=1 Tax=Amycolatopsis sp. FBCC-B4732 TaxID=3079339 RepID=UPI001FF2AFE4|nr:roadblock/LC7 domain-containing protein [Amycolatopsis sp. FBCC-B4732]UOX90899.1 roadblock/LC7 domain-containing protein [Amycolatopsis sp. FBCC-B4732]
MRAADTHRQHTPAPLPVRTPPAADSGPPPEPAARTPPPDAARTLAALRRIRDQVDQVAGLLVATHDGLVLADDTTGVEADSVAAMSAAAAGLAAQFTAQARIGDARCAMFEGSSGYVCVFPVEGSLLLVVFGEPDITMGLFTLAAKQALTLLRQTTPTPAIWPPAE